MKGSKELLEEQQNEDYIQDLLFLQQAQHDEERTTLSRYSQPEKIGKRIFSHKIRWKNRRNSFRFARKYANHLPF